jgi:hypothetical protein
MSELRLSPFQQRVAVIPECYDVLLGGGRGGAKSYSMAILALRHVEQYGARTRVLFIRRTYKGLADFENLTRDLFSLVYRTSATYNTTEHVWRFPNGAYMGQYAAPDLLDKLRSNLRGPPDIPSRCVVAPNPCDVGPHWLAKRDVFVGAPWVPFVEDCSRREWVYAPSTYRENPFIDQDAYAEQLRASCPTDPELRRCPQPVWAIGAVPTLRNYN